MKYKKLMKTFFMILCVLSISTYTKTEAKQTCTTQEKNTLIQLAHNVKFSYELLPDEGNNNRTFMLTISNLVEEVEVRYGFSTYTYDKNSSTPGIAKMGESFAGGYTHEMLIYASSNTNCSGQVLTTKIVSIPKYNSYSEREECQEIEDFKLCQKWYAGSISETEFKKQVEAYKESLKNNNETKEQQKEKLNILDSFIKLYTENMIISIPITLLVLLIIVFIIRNIIKKKNRVKIDL